MVTNKQLGINPCLDKKSERWGLKPFTCKVVTTHSYTYLCMLIFNSLLSHDFFFIQLEYLTYFLKTRFL